MVRPEVKAECIRLRVEERMSLREIHAQTGAAKGTLSGWLKSYPLTEEEKAERQRTRKRYRAPKKDRGEESKHYVTVQGHDLTQNEKAKIAEAAVMFRATLHRFIIFGSPFDGDRADWVIEADGKLQRVQVKWASNAYKSSLPVVSVRRSSVSGTRTSRYDEGDFDFLIGYDLFTDTCYVWSWEEVKAYKNSVTVCPEAAEQWDKLRR